MLADASRRALDIIGSGCGLVLLSPVLVAVGMLVRLDSPGPVLHRAQRVGKDGRLFRLLKFRSMVVDAERVGPAITTAGDPRITHVGRMLRRSKLDELPQLINVLRGDMSLVGPRPEHPSYVALYSSEQRRILRVRPGITSAASLRYRSEAELLEGPDWEFRYRTEVLPAKLEIDLEYLAERTLWSDVRLITATLSAVVLGR